MADIRTFTIDRDWHGIGCKIFAKKEIALASGLTVLVGCNGAGKSTFLYQLKSILTEQKASVMMFDNMRDGGVMGRQKAGFDLVFLGTSLCASEGENISMNLGKFAGKLGQFVAQCPDGEDIFILVDAVDSGYSIDNIVDLKQLFNLILEKENGKHSVYIIAAANEYELCRGESCWDVNSCKYINFPTYDDYRKFIIASRKKKDSRKYKEAEK